MKRAEPEPGSVIADRNRATGGQRWDQTVPCSGDTSRQRPCLLGVQAFQRHYYTLHAAKQGVVVYHRLRGSASPVLTATHHSYGSLAWLWLFFRPTSGGQTPQPILTQNGSNDVDSRKDVPFAVKIATFHTPWSPGPLKGQNFANFGLRHFSLDLAFKIRGPEREHPLFFIGAQWKWHIE